MVYEVTVDYVTTTTVLVEAGDEQGAVDATYEYLRTDKGLDSVFQAEMENAQRHWSAFEVADVAAAPHIEPRDAEIRQEPKTPFRCPKCGQTASFTVYGIVFHGACLVTEGGWDYWTEGGDVEIADGALVECDECHHRAAHEEFDV